MRVGLNSGQADAAGGPAGTACWGGPEMAVREAQDEAPIARTLPSHTRSDSASSVSSMSRGRVEAVPLVFDISEQAWRVAVQQPEQQRGPLPGCL